jgi:hypothetical protein
MLGRVMLSQAWYTTTSLQHPAIFLRPSPLICSALPFLFFIFTSTLTTLYYIRLYEKKQGLLLISGLDVTRPSALNIY